MLKRDRYFSPGYDAPGYHHLLGMLPAMFGYAALRAGISQPSGVAYKPFNKRLNNYIAYPSAYDTIMSEPAVGDVFRVRQRDFELGSRKFKRAAIRRFKVAMKRRKYIRAVSKTFF